MNRRGFPGLLVLLATAGAAAQVQPQKEDHAQQSHSMASLATSHSDFNPV